MKKLMLICAPVSSRSGYGDHARDLVWSFLKHNKYDIRIMDVRWGDCPRNALDINNPNDKKIMDVIMKTPELEKQPDIYVDIRIPNEFETHGKFNIGITAGVETNAVSQKWLESCNKMDLVIVPSEHSKYGFVNSVYDKVQNMPDGQQQKVGELKLEKPMEVLFEGANEDIYKPLDENDIDSEFLNMVNEIVSEDFAFLSVGQWGNGDYGNDRKDIGKLIKVFCESFSNKENMPALILKTNGATYSIMDREECIHKIKKVKDIFPDVNIPNIYLLHGSLSNKEMNYLYNHPKVKAMVSFTHGEGFGRPLLEATMTGLPVIASNWSGQVDFLDTSKSLLLPGKLNQVPESAVWDSIIIKESQWFTVDESQATKALIYTYKNYEDVKSKADDLFKINSQKFTLNDMTTKLDEIMGKYISDMPTQVGLKLPKLKKLKKDDNKKVVVPPSAIKLPKLKKLTGEQV